MSIRLQNILAVVPIFIVVAVLGGWLRYSAEREEIQWGLQQEAISVATAIAAHFDGQRWGEVLAASGGALPQRIEVDITRVLQGGKARRLALYSGDLHSKLYKFVADPRNNRSIEIPPEAIISLREGHSYITPFAEEDPQVNILNSFAPVRTGDGSTVGAVGVQTNVDSYFVRSREILQEAILRSILVCLFGWGVALAISSLVRGRIRELTNVAKGAAAGSNVSRVEPSGVQELRDLGNTFNTMVSVMGEVVQKTKNSLIENEQFRTERDLREVYVETFYAPLWSGAGKYQVLGCLANERCIGDFFGVLELENRVVSFVGRVAGESVANRMLSATSAHLYCEEALPHLAPEEVLVRLKQLATLEAWDVISWGTDAEEVTEWHLDSEKGTVRRQELGSLPETSFLHTLSPEAARRIQAYVRCVPQVSPIELCTEVSQLLKSERQGALLIIGEK